MNVLRFFVGLLCLFILLPFGKSQPASCNTWDELANGLVYGTPTGYAPDSIFYIEDQVSFSLFPWENSAGVTAFDQLFVTDTPTVFTNQYAELRNVGLLMDYQTVPGINSQLGFSIEVLSAELTLQIDNGPVHRITTFDDLPTDVAPGIEFRLISTTNSIYNVQFRGPVRTLRIAGERLRLDNICFVQTNFISQCGFDNLSFTSENCTPDDQDISLNFDYSDHGHLGFSLTVNGENPDTVNYYDLPYALGNFPQGAIFTIALQDVAQPNCRLSMTSDSVNCVIVNSSELTTQRELQFFPNPITNSRLHCPGIAEGTPVLLYSLDGKLNATSKVTHQTITFPSRLTGLYVLHIQGYSEPQRLYFSSN